MPLSLPPTEQDACTAPPGPDSAASGREDGDTSLSPKSLFLPIFHPDYKMIGLKLVLIHSDLLLR